MTILAAIFIFSLGASAGAGLLGFFIMGRIADLEADNAELRVALEFDADDGFEQSLAELKKIVSEPEEAA